MIDFGRSRVFPTCVASINGVRDGRRLRLNADQYQSLATVRCISSSSRASVIDSRPHSSSTRSDPSASNLRRPHNHFDDNDGDDGPTTGSIAELRSLLPLPPELTTTILDLAEYWVCASSFRRSWAPGHECCNTRFLTSPPIPRGSDFLHPLRQVAVTIVSRVDGWSGEPSQTWFELTVNEPGSGGGERSRVEIASNPRPGADFVRHRTIVDNERVLSAALQGDTASVWVVSLRHGWLNHVRSVEIEIYVAY